MLLRRAVEIALRLPDVRDHRPLGRLGVPVLDRPQDLRVVLVR